MSLSEALPVRLATGEKTGPQMRKDEDRLLERIIEQTA